MAKGSNDRHIHFNYFPEFIEHWEQQPQEMKTLCDSLGKEHGYTGINVFYILFIQYWTHKEGNITRRSYAVD